MKEFDKFLYIIKETLKSGFSQKHKIGNTVQRSQRKTSDLNGIQVPGSVLTGRTFFAGYWFCFHMPVWPLFPILVIL